MSPLHSPYSQLATFHVIDVHKRPLFLPPSELGVCLTHFCYSESSETPLFTRGAKRATVWLVSAIEE